MVVGSCLLFVHKHFLSNVLGCGSEKQQVGWKTRIKTQSNVTLTVHIISDSLQGKTLQSHISARIKTQKGQNLPPLVTLFIRKTWGKASGNSRMEMVFLSGHQKMQEQLVAPGSISSDRSGRMYGTTTFHIVQQEKIELKVSYAS